MKYSIRILILFCSTTLLAQVNLVDTSTWTTGQGAVTGFTLYGDTTENERLTGVDPEGQNSLLWMCIPDNSPTNTWDGGWRTDYQNIDPTKTYRLTVWMKKTGSASGNSYLGLNSVDNTFSNQVLNLSGTTNNNPYFWYGDLPELDKWYLVVGFIHGSSYSGGTMGAMYDGVTGEVLSGVSFTDYKFGSTAEQLRHRSSLFAVQNDTDRQYMWNPTMYEVNGSEPSVEELLNLNEAGSGVSHWTEDSGHIYYNTGNVGIGIPNPAYKLAVNGNIRTKEIKVEIANWPDYVFQNDYKLLSLEDLEKFILENGHLPNMPTALEVQNNGVDLGEMNKLLLEKIEELTIYILQQEERIDKLVKANVN